MIHPFVFTHENNFSSLCSSSGFDCSGLVGVSDPGLEAVARLLGVAQQHGGVGFVEDGVVHGGVADAQRTFHHHHLSHTGGGLLIDDQPPDIRSRIHTSNDDVVIS